MSRINQLAAARLSSSQINGPKLLNMFEQLLAQMETLKAQGHFAQMQFVTDPQDMKPGDVIPEIHLSLRTYNGPIIGEPLEVEEDD